jgi:hypothetical protein
MDSLWGQRGLLDQRYREGIRHFDREFEKRQKMRGT